MLKCVARGWDSMVEGTVHTVRSRQVVGWKAEIPVMGLEIGSQVWSPRSICFGFYDIAVGIVGVLLMDIVCCRIWSCGGFTYFPRISSSLVYIVYMCLWKILLCLWKEFYLFIISYLVFNCCQIVGNKTWPVGPVWKYELTSGTSVKIKNWQVGPAQ
jgi:hypothetical protein